MEPSKFAKSLEEYRQNEGTQDAEVDSDDLDPADPSADPLEGLDPKFWNVDPNTGKARLIVQEEWDGFSS